MALFSRSDKSDPVQLLREGRFEEAAKILARRLKQNPDDMGLRLRLAEAWEGMGRKEEAARVYREEADSALRSGQRPQASALLKKALRLLPGDPEVAARLQELESGAETRDPGQSFSFDLSEEGPREEAPPPAESLAAKEPALERGPAPAPPPPVEEELLLEASPEVPEAVEAAKPESAPPPPVEPSEETGNYPSVGEGVFATLHGLLPDLRAEELGRLAALLRERPVSAGEVLLREGETGDSLFLVAQGLFEVRGSFEEGEVLLGRLQRGDVIGEVGFLRKVPRTATVTAVQPGLVLELDGTSASRWMEETPTLRERLEAVLEARVRKTLEVLLGKEPGNDGDTQS